jgi:hypothetical protein
MRNLFYKSFFALLLFCFLTAGVQAQVYTLEKTVVAGGSEGAGGSFALDSTTGQAAAGNALRGGSYAMTVGFWSYSPPLAPTASNVSISGRVLSANGQGIRDARLVLTNSAGEARYAQTGSFGYFRFMDVPVGETYVLTVYARRFTFAEPSRIIALHDDLTDMNFTSELQP